MCRSLAKMICLIAAYAFFLMFGWEGAQSVVKFDIQALQVRELREAWPAVRSGPYANIDWWLTDGADLIDGGGGVLVARALRGDVHGVATFYVSAGLAKKRVLRIPLLISLDLSRGAPAKAALLAALERIAVTLECSHVAFPLACSFGLLRRPRSWHTLDERSRRLKGKDFDPSADLRTNADRQGFRFRRT